MAIWKCLEETYKVYSTSSLLLLIFKLSTIQMNEGKNIIIYIRKLEETTKQLSSIVEKVFDMCFVIISLKNLLEIPYFGGIIGNRTFYQVDIDYGQSSIITISIS